MWKDFILENQVLSGDCFPNLPCARKTAKNNTAVGLKAISRSKIPYDSPLFCHHSRSHMLKAHGIIGQDR
ncbi:MAG: hypothetical protein CVV34_06400 [Methanomicrobiales archaeon HGW-Methanomicrobiales-5]|nr:MAG: hypothetical protein CVV34_06400 [Methanomicrobiales archaeon HGW-Methanomicrobiales-5]